MRLLTFRTDAGEAHVGALRGDQIVDLSVLFSPAIGDAQPRAIDMLFVIMLYMIEQEQAGLNVIRNALDASNADLQAKGALLSLRQERLSAPIPHPRKNIMCVGRNYYEHAVESARSFGEAPPPPRPDYPL